MHPVGLMKTHVLHNSGLPAPRRSLDFISRPIGGRNPNSREPRIMPGGCRKRFLHRVLTSLRPPPPRLLGREGVARGGAAMGPGADAPIRFHNTCITYSVQPERGRESACVHVFFFTSSSWRKRSRPAASFSLVALTRPSFSLLVCTPGSLARPASALPLVHFSLRHNTR